MFELCGETILHFFCCKQPEGTVASLVFLSENCYKFANICFSNAEWNCKFQLVIWNSFQILYSYLKLFFAVCHFDTFYRVKCMNLASSNFLWNNLKCVVFIWNLEQKRNTKQKFIKFVDFLENKLVEKWKMFHSKIFMGRKKSTVKKTIKSVCVMCVKIFKKKIEKIFKRTPLVFQTTAHGVLLSLHTL